MTPVLFEDIRINAERIVAAGVLNYEREFGRFKIDSLKQKFLTNSLELFLRIVERVYNKDEVSILPIKQVILKSLFDLGFDTEALVRIYSEINAELVHFIQQKPNYDANLTRIFRTYLELISENIADYGFYAASSVTDILQNQPEYQYSDELISFIPRSISDNTIYTLYPEERNWEVFSASSPNEAYSPLSYNRIASKAGFPEYRIDVSYDSLVVYEDELYKLRPDVSAPSRDQFDSDQWIKYSSRLLDQTKTFRSIYSEKIKQVFGKFADEGFAINDIISDSFVSKYPTSIQTDRDLLPNTFAGVGKQVFDTAEQLEQIVEGFGNYEGSVVGGLEYIAQFTEYLLAASFGRNVPSAFDVVDGQVTFGKFNILFASRMSENKIPGLKFLNGFNRLRSFAHGQGLSAEDIQTPEKVIYNPVYAQFKKGIQDTFTGLGSTSGYVEPARVDLLLYAIESLYRKASSIGDLIKAGLNSLNTNGQISGYEGLGSIEVQFEKLQTVFPPSTFFLDLPEGTKIGPGMTGALRYLLNNYSRFSQGTINPILPGRSLEFLEPWLERISNKLEELLDTLRSIGIGSSAFIPNLSFKGFEYENTQFVGFLRSLGFRDSEIDQLLNVRDFSELIQKFAPLSDSSDLKSFFKAYELSQLIYEFGGQAGVDTYIQFLYSSNSLDSLLNILDLSQKDKSKFTYVQLSRYPKLIGLLIGLTYAVDPQQLVRFNRILGANNLTLLESISFLYQQGETTIIKRSEDVSLLQPMVEQIINGVYAKDAFSSPALNYDQVNQTVPIALRQWTKIIGDNLGRVESKQIIQDLYDRASGLTPKELITILNYPESPNKFGGLIDGFMGGNFTAFLKYANITGLGLKLGFYKNSYQINNFEVVDSGQFAIIPNLMLALEDLVDSMSIIKTVFNSALDYTFIGDQELGDNIRPLVLAQNKTYETLPTLIQSETQGSSLGQRNTLASEASIVESPGIGNSRLPNRIPALNSITPEQFNALADNRETISSLVTVSNGPLGLINNFIRFTEENKLANEIITTDEIVTKVAADSKEKSFTPATQYELIENEMNTRPISRPYEVSTIYKQLSNGDKVVSSGLGTNYIDKNNDLNLSTLSQDLVSPFSPVESCRRFGGTNCEELYENVPDRCAPELNKSLAPETYSQVPGVSPTSVVIDRPLGAFAEYKPSEILLSTSAFKAPPAYYSLLPETTAPGEKAEPVLTTVFSEPLVFDKGTGELSEYGNSEFGIVEFIRAKLERNSEFSCAGFDSPYLYQICMNVMKCKRFVPPMVDRYSLDFCPRTLSGGRLK